MWDPREDAFDIAYRKILERAKTIALEADQDMVSYCIPTDLHQLTSSRQDHYDH